MLQRNCSSYYRETSTDDRGRQDSPMKISFIKFSDIFFYALS